MINKLMNQVIEEIRISYQFEHDNFNSEEWEKCKECSTTSGKERFNQSLKSEKQTIKLINKYKDNLTVMSYISYMLNVIRYTKLYNIANNTNWEFVYPDTND